ncbi:MAG: stage III sporulation protein AE [Clostridia bacterium]|nr:stage III sporulation protein AE [Clostridia bacterium]
MTRKKFFIIIILSLTIFSFGLNISSTLGANSSLIEMQDALVEEVDDTLDQIDFSEIQGIVDGFSKNQKEIFSIGNIKDKIKQVVNGESTIDYSSFLSGVLALVVELVADYLPMIAIIISVGILSSVLASIKSKFNEKSVGDVVHFVCFCVVIIVVATIVKSLINNTGQAIFSMQSQMGLIFPVLLTMMTAIGSTASVGLFQPSLAIFSNLSSTLFTSVIIPIFTLSFCFGIIGNMSNSIKLDKFNSFLSSLFKWLVGILFTVFFALMSIQGISAGSFDSVSIRTMKFTMSSYVPVLGGYLSQGMDILMASSVLIKNAVGLTGIIILITSALAPILEIVVVSLLLKIASAILQPLNNDRITNFLQATSKCIIMLSTCMIIVSFMYFIMIGLCMATANII